MKPLKGLFERFIISIGYMTATAYIAFAIWMITNCNR